MSKRQQNAEDLEFEDQMRRLTEEAETQFEQPAFRKQAMSLLQLMRPLVVGMEAISKATTENTATIARLQAAMAEQPKLPDIVTAAREQTERDGPVTQKLFDALHDELKGYKDEFLLEVLHKPLIRDLIALYDDLAEVKRQMDETCGICEKERAPAGENMERVRTNFDHAIEFLLEILTRMEVVRIEPSSGKIDKQTQRAVLVEPAASAPEDGDIVRSMRPGFMWKKRLFRAEEIVVRKWKGNGAGDENSQSQK